MNPVQTLAEAARTPPASAASQAIASAAKSAVSRGEAAGASGGGLGRGQILDATWQCLREQGYDATTIRRIAGRLDCAIGSIYRYYRDKHDLLSCVTQRPYESVVQAIEAGEPFGRSAARYVALATAEPQSYFLMFWLANQKLQGQSQADATFTLPTVVQAILDGWATLLGGQDVAMRRWAMIHGAMTAGVADPLALLASLGWLDEADASAQEAPQGLARPQAVVTVMHTPPLPRAWRQVTAEASRPGPVHATPITSITSVTPAAAPSLSARVEAQEDDVCLL